MKYPNYIKIYFDNEEWCEKLNTKKKEYFSEDLALSCTKGKENELVVFESETYSIEDLKNDGLKYEKITEKEYKEFIRQKLKQQFKEEIERLYKRIEETKREEELILSKYC